MIPLGDGAAQARRRRTPSVSSCTSRYRRRRRFSPSPSTASWPAGLPPTISSACRRKVDVGNLIDYLQDGVFGRILQDGRISAFDRELAIASFPVGIDVDSFVGSRPKRISAEAAVDHPPHRRRPARLHQGAAAEVSRLRPLSRQVSRLSPQGDPVADRAAHARERCPPTPTSATSSRRCRGPSTAASASWIGFRSSTSIARRRASCWSRCIASLAHRACHAAARRHEPRRQGVRRGAGPRRSRRVAFCRALPARPSR